MKFRDFITFLIILYCVSCKSPNPKNMVLTPSDTLKNIIKEHFQTIIKQDSIKILRFDTVRLYRNKEYFDRVIHYLDFKVNNPHKRMLQKINMSDVKSEARKFMVLNHVIPTNSIVNPYSEILGTYINAKIYKDNFCMDNNIIYFYCITDSLFIFKSMEGYEGHYYHSVKKEKNVYNIEISSDYSKTRKIEIKLLLDKFNAIIWRDTYRLKTQDPEVRFNILIPIEIIANIPVLYTKDTDGLLEYFDGFDQISIEDLFNKR
jgi:hypothetical protein